MSKKKYIAILAIPVVMGSFAFGRVTAITQPVVQEGLRVNCTYPYGKDGFLTNNCYAFINMAIRNGYKVSHDPVRPDGSVTFIVK